MNAPASGFERLVRAEADGWLGELAQEHGLALVVVFGSVARGTDHPRDLDVAVSGRGGGALDPVAVVTALMELSDVDDLDLLDLNRAGAVARQHALVGGIPLHEHPAGEFARQQMRASGERLSTEWMRLRHLERLAGPVSPRRLDPSIVEVRLTAMTELLDDLAGVDTARLDSDRLLRHAVERILTQLVESAAGVNEHVAGARLGRSATSYRDSFVLVDEAGLVDEALRDALIPSVGLRNVLVHEYVAVHLGQVRAAVPIALDVYRRHVRPAAASVVDGGG